MAQGERDVGFGLPGELDAKRQLAILTQHRAIWSLHQEFSGNVVVLGDHAKRRHGAVMKRGVLAGE